MDLVYALFVIFGLASLLAVVIAVMASVVYLIYTLQPQQRAWWWPRTSSASRPDPSDTQLSDLRAAAVVLAMPGVLGGVALTVVLLGIPLIFLSAVVMGQARWLRRGRDQRAGRPTWFAFIYAATMLLAATGYTAWASFQHPLAPGWIALAASVFVWVATSVLVGWQMHVASAALIAEPSSSESSLKEVTS